MPRRCAACGRSWTRLPPSPRSATRPRRSPRARSSRRRAASSGSAPSARCRSPSGCTRASTRPDGHVGLITYMRTDSTAIACVAMAEAQAVIRERFGERYGTGKGRVYKTKQKGAQEAHESIRPTVVPAGPGLAAGASSRRDEHKLYRLIWQRAIASQMAPKELETTTIELVAGDYRLRASATRTLFDGFARRLHRGPGRRRRGGRADAAAAARGRRHHGRVRHADPALHGAAAPLHGGDADQGPRGERHRPPLHVRRHDLDHRRSRLRQASTERRLHPEEIGEIVTDFLVDLLRRVRGPRVHRPHGGGARRGRRAASASGCRCCARSSAR